MRHTHGCVVVPVWTLKTVLRFHLPASLTQLCHSLTHLWFTERNIQPVWFTYLLTPTLASLPLITTWILRWVLGHSFRITASFSRIRKGHNMISREIITFWKAKRTNKSYLPSPPPHHFRCLISRKLRQIWRFLSFTLQVITTTVNVKDIARFPFFISILHFQKLGGSFRKSYFLPRSPIITIVLLAFFFPHHHSWYYNARYHVTANRSNISTLNASPATPPLHQRLQRLQSHWLTCHSS